MPHPTPAPKPKTQRRDIVFVLAMAVFASGWLGTFGYGLWHMRSDALSTGAATAELHAREFEEHLTQTLQMIDLVALGTDEPALTPDNWQELGRRLEAAVRPAPSLRSLSVLDENGYVVASSSTANLGVKVDLSSFFPAASAASDVLRVGSPWLGRDFADAFVPDETEAVTSADATLIPVTRRLPGTGSPHWLLAALNPDHFLHRGTQLVDIQRARVQWLRYDGVLLTSTAIGDQPGMAGAAGRVREQVLLRDQGVFAQTLPDASPVITAYRASSRFPVVVSVHMDRGAILDRWAADARQLASVVLPILLALVAAGTWVWLRRKALAEKQAELDKEHRLAASVFQSSRDAIIITDAQARIVSVNAAFEQVTGFSASEVTGCNPRIMASGLQSKAFYADMWLALLRDGHWRGEMVNRHKDGELYVVQLTVNAVKGSDGNVRHYAGIIVDITQRKAAEERLQLAASVFSHAREGILITDPAGDIIDVNEAFSRITGYDRAEVLGRNARLLNSGRQDKAFYSDMWRALLGKGQWSGEIWNRRKSGEVYAEMLTISAVRDAQGKTLRYVALFSDISQQKENELRLKQIAHYDALTGLPNRALLSDRLRQAMNQAQRRGERLAVVFLDLDGFKSVNDSHGHEMGDRLLIMLSMRMKQALRDGDTLARLGGDEFVAVLVNMADADACVPVLERLAAAAAEPVLADGATLQVTASLGVAFYPQTDTVDADQLLRQADQAMYQAKLTGKNRHHFFDAEQDRDIRGRHENVEQLRMALEHQQFVLHYQPKVNMRTGQVLGLEALIRWNHPERGLLPPGMFLPMLENQPLSIDLGRWVLRTALAQIERWKAIGLTLPVSVNIDAQQLQQPDFVNELQQLLAEHPGVAPGDLELEILETNALDDMTRVSRVMDACRDIGVSFALDDFGTGYSSLTYLRHLPARTLKVDRSFVRDMLDDPEDLAILDGVIGLSIAFRRHVIAEGVETFEHGELLLRLGCDRGQGYAIAKPMPAEAVPEWTRSWKSNPRWLNTPRTRRDDLPLLFAAVEHRAWTGELVEYLRGERKAPPTMNQRECRFGQWLEHDGGRARHSHHRGFAALERQHRVVHALADELRGLPREQALVRLPEIQAARDHLLDALMDVHEQG